MPQFDLTAVKSLLSENVLPEPEQQYVSLLVKEIELLEGSTEDIQESVKTLENALYLYVTAGCEYPFTKGAFPELQEQYDTESYDMLEEKIRILAEIAKSGAECDYKSIPGFEDILENKPLDGIKTIVLY